jgi:hypothetical protein
MRRADILLRLGHIKLKTAAARIVDVIEGCFTETFRDNSLPNCVFVSVGGCRHVYVLP